MYKFLKKIDPKLLSSGVWVDSIIKNKTGFNIACHLLIEDGYFVSIKPVKHFMYNLY